MIWDGKNIFDIISVSGKPPGYDRVRNAEIGNKDFELDVLEEAYTSEHWIVRIFKVIPNDFTLMLMFRSGERSAKQRDQIEVTI